MWRVDLRLVCVVTGVAVLMLGVLAVSAQATSSERYVHFATEDRNIECLTIVSLAPNVAVECVMYSSGYDPSAPEETNYHPHWLVFSRGVGLKGTTRRGLGGSSPPRILHDGQAVAVGNFRCKARDSRLTCVSRISGHGFFLSQGRQRTF